MAESSCEAMGQRSIAILVVTGSTLEFDPRACRAAGSASEAGHRVTVICRHPVRDYPFKVIPLNVRQCRSPRTVPRLLERIRFTARAVTVSLAEAPEIVHAHDLGMLPAGWLLARRYRAALVYDSHELWVEHEHGIRPLLLRAILLMEGWLARRSDAVVTVSPLLAERLAQRYQIALPWVVLNAPPYQEFKGSSEHSLREEFGLAESSRVVLFQGQFGDYSGLDQLIQAAKLMGADTHVILRGFGPVEPWLRDIVERECLQGKVHFAQPVPMGEMSAYAVTADVGVIPMISGIGNCEVALPNKLFEYLMAGLPVAATPLPALRALIESEGVGRVFSGFDAASIAVGLVWMLEHQEEMRDMRERALACAKRFCWEHQYETLASVYSRVVDEGGRGSRRERGMKR